MAILSGKTDHYFDWAIFNSYVTNYQGASPCFVWWWQLVEEANMIHHDSGSRRSQAEVWWLRYHQKLWLFWLFTVMQTIHDLLVLCGAAVLSNLGFNMSQDIRVLKGNGGTSTGPRSRKSSNDFPQVSCCNALPWICLKIPLTHCLRYCARIKDGEMAHSPFMDDVPSKIPMYN